MNRENVLLFVAFGLILGIVALLILVPTTPKEVQGFVISLGGMFARSISTAFDFEFGSSKGSRQKDTYLSERRSQDTAP